MQWNPQIMPDIYCDWRLTTSQIAVLRLQTAPDLPHVNGSPELLPLDPPPVLWPGFVCYDFTINVGLFDSENLSQISCNETCPHQTVAEKLNIIKLNIRSAFTERHCYVMYILYAEYLVTSISGDNLQRRDTETQTEINDFESKTRIFWLLLISLGLICWCRYIKIF